MRLVVTGGAGFIGSNLVRAAVARGWQVTVLDDLSSGSVQALGDVDAELVEASVLDERALARALSGADCVIHLAALASVPASIAAPLTSHETNATASLLVLEEARRAGVEHVVVASSSAVYGSEAVLPISEREPVRPISPYGVAKLATEQYALAYQECYGLRTLAFRLFNVYGPGQPAGHAYAAVVPAFLNAVLTERAVTLHGDGTQSRDFTFVGTVCEVLLEAATRRVSHPHPVNLAYGSNVDLLSLLHLVEELTGRVATVQSQPARRGDVKHSQADNTVLRSLFPEVHPNELADGLSQTIQWFEDDLRRQRGAST